MSDIRSEISPHIDTLVDTFIPSHIRDNYPAIVQFVREYLIFLETQNNSAFYQNTLPDQRFIETQQEQFLKRIEKEIGIFVPREYEADPKLFYNKISELWRSRGSRESIETFFRIFFNEPVEVTYPNEQILIPSNSVWFQESFITLDTPGVQDIPLDDIEVYRLFRGVESFVETSRFEEIVPGTFRVYSETEVFENVELGDEYVIRNRITDDFIEVGEVVLSPTSVSVQDGGSSWKPGQVFRFPGTVRDTLIRVDKITDDNAIERVTIVENGYEHSSSPTLLVSPFPIRPSGTSDFNLTEELLPSGGTRFNLFVSSDNVGTSDVVNGLLLPGDYFLEVYVADLKTGKEIEYESDYFFNEYISLSEDKLYVGSDVNDRGDFDFSYTGREVLSTTSVLSQEDGDDNFDYQVVDITLEEFLRSRATITMNFAPFARLEGEWRDLSSIISEDFTRIQDSFFYQTYSYELNSIVDPLEYRYIVPEFNVAGQKPFFNYENKVTLDTFVVDASFDLPFIEIDFFDIADINDDFIVKDVRKQLLDSSEVFEKIFNNLNKKLFDNVTLADTQILNPTKVPSDDTTVSEDISQKVIEKSLIGTSPAFVQDLDIKNTIKSLSDRLTYFAEDYEVGSDYSTGIADSAEISLNGSLVVVT